MTRDDREKNRPRRRRRSATEAKRLILDAAEAQLREAGPDGIRLQDVAAAVGVSHPTILHHFGSREDLVEAVSRRALESLTQELIALLSERPQGRRPRQILDRVFELLGDRGHARALAWLALSGRQPPTDAHPLKAIAQTAHRVRAAEWAERGCDEPAVPPFEDTLFTFVLAGLAVFGDSVVGDAMRHSAGLGTDCSAQERFRAWFCDLLLAHLKGYRE